MLINVFGIWLMAAQVTALIPPNTIFGWNPNGRCYINFSTLNGVYSDHTCEEVAAEINRQQGKAMK